MGKKERGFFIAGGIEFLVLAMLVGGFAAVDQYQEQRSDGQQIEQSVSAAPAVNDQWIADL